MSDTTTETAVETRIYEAVATAQRELNAEWQRDVERLNEVANQYADRNSLCSAYEDALEAINSACMRIHLNGREQDYTATISVNVSFTATSGTAHDIASNIADQLAYTTIGEYSLGSAYMETYEAD